MEARMVAGGASDVVLANFRRVRDTTADLIATGRLGTRDAFSALGSAAGSFYKDLGLENVTELIQSDIENAVDNNALNEKNRMNFNKTANIIFSTTAITAIPGFIGGASAYNKAKADITTTAIWNSTQNIEDFNAFTEELTKLNKLSTEDAAGIRSAVSYVKEELDQYEDTTKENAVGATGLILTRRALESKLANTSNQRAKDIISTKIEGLNVQIDEILGGKAKVEIAPEVADVLTEEKGKEDVPTKGTVEYKAGAEPETDYKVGDTIVIGGEQRVVTSINTNEEGNIVGINYTTKEDSDASVNTGTPPVAVSETAAETATATTETLAEETPTEMVAEEFDDVEIISDYNETPVTYKGESGILRKDGQTWTVETPTTIYDLDGVDDNTSLSTAGVQIADKININEDGSFSIRDKEYANMFSDPLTAITINEDGTYTVRLDTKGDNPQPRNFRGQLAEDLAYQITLQKITKEDAKGFEEYINNTDANGEIPSPVTEAAIGTDAEVSSTKKQRVKASPQATQTSQQGVSTTDTENVENVAPMSTNTASSLPTTLTDVTLTNKAGTITTGTFTYNEEKQTWSKVNPNGKKTPVNSQAQKDQLNTLRQEKQQQAAMDDVSIINSKSDDIISELNKLKTPKEKLNWLKEKGLITSIVINGKSYNSIDYNDRIMVLVKIGKYNIPFYISTGQAGKKNVKAGNWYAIFGIGESGWINKGSEELINKQYDFPVFQKIAKILNEGVGNFESREDNGNGKIKDFVGYMEDTKKAISEFNKQMGLPITPAKNNTESKVFYENVNSILNLINSELNSLSSNNTQTTNEKESNSTNQTSNNDEGQTNTQEGQVGTTVGQEGEVSTTQTDGNNAETPSVTAEPTSGKAQATKAADEALNKLKEAARKAFLADDTNNIIFDPRQQGSMKADAFKDLVSALVDYIGAKIEVGKYTVSDFIAEMKDGAIGLPIEISKDGAENLFSRVNENNAINEFNSLGLEPRLRRYATRAMLTESFPEDLKKAIKEGYKPKERIPDEAIQKFADAFVAELKTEKELLDAIPLLLKSFSDKIASANVNVGPWELRAIKQIDKIINDQYSVEAAAEVFKVLDNVFSIMGSSLREAGINNEDSLFIQLYGRATKTETPLYEAETYEDSGVTNQQVYESIIEMYEQATDEVRAELKAKIAEEIRKAKPTVAFSKETPPPAKLSQRFNEKANAYLESFNARIASGFSSGFDIEALIDYSLYSYYKAAGSLLKAKETLVKKFGQKEVDDNWDKIITSDRFVEATADIARDKLLAALETSTDPKIDNRGLTPSSMVIAAIKKKLLKTNKKTATKKEIEDVIRSKDLDIQFVSDLRRDIRAGIIPLDEDTKAETMNAVDDLLSTLIQDKLDTITAPWVSKTKSRALVKQSLDKLHLTIDDLVKDIVTKNSLVSSISAEFIQRTGLTQAEAKPYLDIIKSNIDELINKRVESKLDRLFTDSYGRDIVAIEKAIKESQDSLAKSKVDLEAKKIELDKARKAGDPNADQLQTERDSLLTLIKADTKRLLSLKSAAKKGIRFIGTAAKNVSKKPTIEKIGDVVRNGGLNKENIREVFAESIGAKSFTKKDAETLRELYQKYDNAEFDVDKENALEDISSFVFAMSQTDKRTFVEIWEGFMHANMLGSTKTADVAYSSGIIGFVSDEVSSIVVQISKDLLDLVTLKGAEFTNTILIFDAMKNAVKNSGYVLGRELDVYAGTKGLSVTDINNDKKNRFNSNLTALKKLRILRDEAKRKGDKETQIALNALIYQQIAGRGLMVADYTVQANGLPYKLHRNLADTARAELLKEGYLNPKYAQILNRINSKLGIDEVEAQLASEGINKGDPKYRSRRADIIYEFLPKESMDKILAEDAMARIALTGRVSGYSGKAVASLNKLIYSIGTLGRDISATGEDSYTALIAATLAKMGTAPFFGASFRVAQRTKNYTPFGLIQVKTKEDRAKSWNPIQVFKDYRYYDINTGQVESVPASPHEKEIRYVNAILPSLVFGVMMMSMFDYDEEEDEWTNNPSNKWFFTTGYSPAMKRKIELSGETYEPYTVYEKMPNNKFRRVYNYKENAAAWSLAIIGRNQEKLLFDVEESQPTGEFNVSVKNPLKTTQIVGSSIRSFMAFSSQGAIESSVGTVGAVAPLLEGGKGDDFAARKMLSGLVGMNMPLSALEAELDNYYSLTTKEGRKKGITPLTDVFDRMLITNPLFDNYDYDVIGRKITQAPYGPVLTTWTTKAVDGLFHASKEERELPEVENLLLKYTDIDKIKHFEFAPIKEISYKQDIVMLPEDPQVVYDVQFAAAKKKGELLSLSVKELDRKPKEALEKELEKINTEANHFAQNEYIGSVLDKFNRGDLKTSKLKNTKANLVENDLQIDEEGNLIKLKISYQKRYDNTEEGRAVEASDKEYQELLKRANNR